jgi:flagellar hook-associated protein 1 FlgK
MASIGLNTGLQALLTAQYALDTVGNNIANANTPGYSRQRVNLVSGLGLDRGNVFIGTGVVARDLSRMVDDLLNKRIGAQLTVVGRIEQQLEVASQIQSVFGDLDGVGIGSMLDGFFDEVSSLSTDPADTVRRTAVVQSAEALAARFREVQLGLAEAGTSTATQASLAVKEVNRLATGIANLNVRIAEIEAGQVTANALRDERQLLVEQLAGIVDVRVKDAGVSGLRVHIGSALLVDGSTTLSLASFERSDGTMAVRTKGGTSDIQNLSGRLGALLSADQDFASELQSGLDGLAKGLILEVNRAHTTGVPGNGPFTKLQGAVPLQLSAQGGVIEAQTLAGSGLPFDVQAGALTVNVHDTATGGIEKKSIEIDPGMTVGELLAAFNAIDGVNASVDNAGHFIVTAEAGHAFDFSKRIISDPDTNGTLGGTSASLGTTGAEPFALVAGDTLDFTSVVGGTTTNVSVAFDSADFADIGAATAEEIAAVLANDPTFAAAGLTAVTENGHVFVQTTSSGATETLTLTGGSAAAALGLTAAVGQTVIGSLDAVDVQVKGNYTGTSDQTFSFVASGDGVIGTTPGLTIDVVDASGQVVSTLDVGAGYVPGSPIGIGQGLSVAFALGEISSTGGDRVSIEAQADSDTSDVLVALGLNTFFTGSTAADIGVREEIADDPDAFAFSSTGSSGDNGVLLELLALQEQSSDALGGRTLGDRYSDVVASVGFEVVTAEASATSSRAVLESLTERRDSVAGVNIDEELVDMLRFEQSFQAAARYLSALNALEDSILSII